MSTIPNNRDDIVLIDSESERENDPPRMSEEDAPPRKKFKKSQNNDAPLVKPFMNSTSEDSDNNVSSSDSLSANKSAESTYSQSSDDSSGSESSLSGLSDGNSESGYVHSLASDPRVSSRKVENEMDGESQGIPSDLGDISTGSSSSDLNAISTHEVPTGKGEDNEATRRVISETRKYLKQHGTMEFLDKYLPTTASSLDLLQLIKKLGFFPKDIPSFNDGDKLIGLIKLLHTAMKRVNSMRSKLDDFYSVEHVVDKIKKAEKILVVTGAGISTSLGIPDFRSSKGFYSQLQYLGLSDPQEVFDLDFFHSDPNIFYLIAYMILPPEKSYTPLHSFIKLLQNKGKLLRNYTQNIDNLESNVGIKPEKLIQCHGSFATASCVTCKYQVKGEKIFPKIRLKEIPYCPKCMKARKILLNKEDAYVPESYGVMKPDITFFGEPLPTRFHNMIRQDLMECDLLISIGTSLKVSPVADIVERIPEHVPQVLINKDPIDHCNFDVSILGYCDDAANFLCERLGKGWNLNHPEGEAAYNKLAFQLMPINENEGHYSLVNLHQG
ncbi:uncharacterized protein AC631_00069 [Debaryomyces fabryi]|uniref:Deacetylase sirtuin-type domain-containing protein n=1 Tax=Debaryomyces fabryi TaxID=58627 RepID=A0A0V1Q739_9ASCO|nr:uncharacterized protein AC631_00069 [Debaryomyces fabryi]KSA04198.1 hypothetical protein AC631_00069 [Debaryomyces fabryi]CUM46255.1 unnamed protein product [Debaryomyces fabryi]